MGNKPMRYFPVFIDLHQAPVAIVGGGEAALQKARLLLKTSARVQIIAPKLIPDLQVLVQEGSVLWAREWFKPDHLDQIRLVYSAIGDSAADGAVADAAKSRNIPVNVVDAPQLCTFITPAIVDRDPVLIAIGTEGAAPVLAQLIKGMLESKLPVRLGALANMAKRLRSVVARSGAGGPQRRAFWREFFSGSISRKFYAGEVQSAEQEALQLISDGDLIRKARGHVSLVGAGPGDPDFLTFKAARALQQADVIVFEPSVKQDILEVARRDARRIMIGNKPGLHVASHEATHAIVIEEARKGNNTVWLKNGDPMMAKGVRRAIDGIQRAGVSFDIVPGVSADSTTAMRLGASITGCNQRCSSTVPVDHASDGITPKALVKPDQSLTKLKRVA